jgi:hypothetical protein
MHGDPWSPESTLAEPESPAELPITSDVRHVVLRLVDGDQIDIGSTRGRDAAVELARTTAAAVDSAADAGVWPEFADRFVRPGAIVSVDVRRSR